MIPERFTFAALDYRSDATSLVWSSGAVDGPAATAAPDVWRYVPGDREPRLIFHNEYRDSTVDLIEGNGAGDYVFVESNLNVYGPGTWRLWYLASGAAQPILLDSGDDAHGLIPFIAMDGERIVWAVNHGPADPSRAVSQLLLATRTDPNPTVLDELPAEHQAFTFPDLDGSRLVYGVAEVVDPASSREEHRVYLRDLDDPGDEPRRLDDSGRAGMPAIAGEFVAWKENLAGDPLLQWGPTLVWQNLRTRERGAIDEEWMHSYVGLGFNYPSIGDRFLAAWDPNHNSLYVFDLQERRPALVEDFGEEIEPPNRERLALRPHVRGSILAWTQGSDLADRAAGPTLKYALLPVRD
ncbi:MAG TPA: hypothetical protein VHK06_04550 [Candidatus Limnocylindria bacterium]|nr:hypothetical protein [Candidatus Limnocylindria bacterium]